MGSDGITDFINRNYDADEEISSPRVIPNRSDIKNPVNIFLKL